MLFSALTEGCRGFLLLALALDFLCDEVLIRLQRALNMDLELDYIIQHQLELGVQLLSQRRRAKSELFIPADESQ